MTTKRFRELAESWKTWATTAEHSEEGWQSDFSEWNALLDAANGVMREGMPDELTFGLLAQVWAAAEADEELLERARECVQDCWPVIKALAETASPASRWQAYEIAAEAGQEGEVVLRKGLADQDSYARHRALLALARLKPRDARALAESTMHDPDPYIRQAAIQMALAASDPAFTAEALRVLAADPVEHVRQAALSLAEKLSSLD